MNFIILVRQVIFILLLVFGYLFLWILLGCLWGYRNFCLILARDRLLFYGGLLFCCLGVSTMPYHRGECWGHLSICRRVLSFFCLFLVYGPLPLYLASYILSILSFLLYFFVRMLIFFPSNVSSWFPWWLILHCRIFISSLSVLLSTFTGSLSLFCPCISFLIAGEGHPCILVFTIRLGTCCLCGRFCCFFVFGICLFRLTDCLASLLHGLHCPMPSLLNLWYFIYNSITISIEVWGHVQLLGLFWWVLAEGNSNEIVGQRHGNIGEWIVIILLCDLALFFLWWSHTLKRLAFFWNDFLHSK